MYNLKSHIWVAIVLGVAFLLALALSYFVLLDISHTSGEVPLQPEIINIAFINFGSYIIYILFILSRALKNQKITAT